MFKTIVYCDRCKKMLLERTQKYSIDKEGVFQETKTNEAMKDAIRYAHEYNVKVHFGMSWWKPNIDSPRCNGFILCCNCLKDLQSFLMDCGEDNDGN